MMVSCLGAKGLELEAHGLERRLGQGIVLLQGGERQPMVFHLQTLCLQRAGIGAHQPYRGYSLAAPVSEVGHVCFGAEVRFMLAEDPPTHWPIRSFSKRSPRAPPSAEHPGARQGAGRG